MVVTWIPGSLVTSYVPVSETHRGGSTDAQGARREGNKEQEGRLGFWAIFVPYWLHRNENNR